MRKQLKRAGALLLALVMTMAMAVTAFAGDDEESSLSAGQIQITNVTDSEQVTANAYQVLEYDSSSGTWVLTSWAETALGNGASAALAVLTNTSTSTESEDTDSTDYSNSYSLATYLTTLANYAADSTKDPAATAITATNSTDTEGSYSSTITLDTTTLGAYLVVLSSDSYSYTNMYVNNFDSDKEGSLGTSTAAAKSTKDNIIDSKVASDTSVAIGDTITYTVTATMPNFSGDSGGDTTGEDVEETVETVALKLSKVDGSSNAITTSSASFTLSYTVDETTYYVTATETSTGSGVYTVSGSTTDSSSATTFSTSTTDGTLTIQGLDPQYTYTITETAAPTGYSTAGSTTLSFTAKTSDGTATESGKYYITFTDTTTNSAYTSTTNSNNNAALVTTVTVTDTVLGSLPTTGGMGILVLTFAGVVMIALFGGAFVALKKRK